MKFQWKKHLLGYLAVAVVCVMIGSAVTLTLQPAAQAENTTTQVVVTSPFTAAIAQVKDSVVGVSNYQTVYYSNRGSSWADYFGFGSSGRSGSNGSNSDVQSQEVLAATGSGVVVGKGYVLTNYHVVEDATSLQITVSNGNSDEADAYDATLVTYDDNLDVAIVYAPELPLDPVNLGDSDTLQVGDWAICIGNPLGEQLSGSVTVGIVSALDRAISSTNYDKYGRKETVTNTMIQTDASINSGNSGGGMFNVNGELMGIPTLKYTGSAYSGTTVEGIGMCIPINAAKPLIQQVLDGTIATPEVETSSASGSDTSISSALVGKPRMGVTISTINSSSSAVLAGILPNGVLVSEVEENSPADISGIQPGDIIVDVNDTVITSSTQLSSMIGEMSAGDVLQVKVYRVPGLLDMSTTDEIPDGEYIDLEVTLAVVDDVKQ